MHIYYLKERPQWIFGIKLLEKGYLSQKRKRMRKKSERYFRISNQSNCFVSKNELSHLNKLKVKLVFMITIFN